MSFSQEPVYSWLLKSETHFGSCVHTFSLSASFWGTFSLVKQSCLFAKQIRPVCGSLEPDTRYFSSHVLYFDRVLGDFSFSVTNSFTERDFINTRASFQTKTQERAGIRGSNIIQEKFLKSCNRTDSLRLMVIAETVIITSYAAKKSDPFGVHRFWCQIHKCLF